VQGKLLPNAMTYQTLSKQVSIANCQNFTFATSFPDKDLETFFSQQKSATERLQKLTKCWLWLSHSN
jgi:hypothetical protein